MALFSFFKKKPTTEEIAISDKEEGLPKQKLALHPTWEDIAQESKYVLQYQHHELPEIEEYEFGFSGVKIREDDGKIFVSTFIRNRVPVPYAPDEITLFLVDADNRMLAKKDIALKELVGNVPAHSNMPWNFVFEKKDRSRLELGEEWQLLCSEPNPHKLELEPSWEEQLSEEQKEQLEELFNGLGDVPLSSLNFTGISANFLEDGSLNVMAFIRNGYNQDVTISQLPLQVLDRKKKVVAKGTFALGEFTVKTNTTKPWSFTFSDVLLSEEERNMNTWKIVIVQ